MDAYETREQYLVRRQRKAALEKCRRIAIVGATAGPNSESYAGTEKLLAFGLEIVQILPGCETYLGFRCYPSLRDVPGKLDMVQVYPGKAVDLSEVVQAAVEKKVGVFWVEMGRIGDDLKEILARGGVQVVEHESLEKEYLKHVSFPAPQRSAAQAPKRPVKVAERMTPNPVTVNPRDGLHQAMEKMQRGHFRHLPVVDDQGRLIGMLSDRDIRLIRPSLALVPPDQAALQLWSIAVRQAAVFDPITVSPDAVLEQAAEMMLHWEVGALPVVDEKGTPIGIITYTDLLREFVAGGNRDPEFKAWGDRFPRL